MKIILRVSALLALLLTVCGAHNVQARRWSPGEAEARAVRGDFNVSDKDQLLADIPHEWKKDHRALVRNIQDGYWGVGARKKGTALENGLEPEEDPLVIKEKGSGLVKNWPKGNTRDKFTSDEKALQDIAYNFGMNLNKLYNLNEELKNDRWKQSFQKKEISKGVELEKLIESEFDEKFKVLISKQNAFFNNLFAFEKGKQSDLNSVGASYLSTLAQLAREKNDLKPQLGLIAAEFNMWVKYRLANIPKFGENFKDLISALERCYEVLGIKNDIQTIKEKDDLGDKEDKDEEPSLIVDIKSIECEKIKTSGAVVSYTLLKKLAQVNLDNIDNNVLDKFRAGQTEGFLLKSDILDTYQRLLLIAAFNYNDANLDNQKKLYDDVIESLKNLTKTFYCQWITGKNKEQRNTILEVITNFEGFLKKNSDLWKDNVHQPFINSLRSLFN